MNKTLLKVFLTSVFALAVVVVVALPPTAFTQSPANSPTHLQRWEYRIMPLGLICGTVQPVGTSILKPFEDGLNKLGADGWELVAMDTIHGPVGNSNGAINKVAILKRPYATQPK